MEWIITAKISGKDGYNVFKAFNELPCVDWHRSKATKNVSEGDIVYIYVGRPYMKIMLKTKCIQSHVSIEELIDDSEYYNTVKQSQAPSEYFRLVKIGQVDDDGLALKTLNELGLIDDNIRGSFKSINNSQLFKYIDEYFNDYLSIEYDEIVSDLKNFESKYKESVIKSRIGQGKYRDGLIEKHGCKCMICNIKIKELLIASHIKEFSIATKRESIDLNNGLLLCANHDKLFDRHLISFDSQGKIIISPKIKFLDYGELKINKDIFIEMNNEINIYMSYHRNKLE